VIYLAFDRLTKRVKLDTPAPAADPQPAPP